MQPIGTWQGVCFSTAEIDIRTTGYDLLVVGMLERAVRGRGGGGAAAVDDALHGTLSRLRDGGIFHGDFGETLMLAQPPAPIAAGSLLLIGMGASLAADAGTVGQLTEQAMRVALRIGAASVGCLLGWSELDIPPDQVEASATAMMHGALRAVQVHGAGAPMRWTFDIRNGEAARTAAALARALADWC